MSYHANHTDYTFQRNNTIHEHDHRKTCIIQQSCFKHQRNSNHELHIQALNIIVADLQNQINNITSGSDDPNNDPGIGTM